MLRNPELSLSQATADEGVSQRSVLKYFRSGFEKLGGRWRARASDKFHEEMYVPDAEGNAVPVHTTSFAERKIVGAYIREIGRFLQDKPSSLSSWDGQSIAGVELVTSPRVLKSIEAQLADFAIYNTFAGGAE